MSRLHKPLTVLCALILAGTACSREDPDQTVSRGEGSNIVPFTTLEDVVSFADHVSVLRIEDERPIDPLPQESPEGAPTVGRELTVTVETHLWTRAGSDRRVTRVFTPAGWVRSDGELTPLAIGDAPRMQVGERYVVALIFYEGRWTLQNTDAVLPLEGNSIQVSDTAPPPAAQLAGSTPEGVARQLDQTEPAPLAAEYAELNPIARAIAVRNARSSGMDGN